MRRVNRRYKGKSPQGFTLIEVLFSIAIVAMTGALIMKSKGQFVAMKQSESQLGYYYFEDALRSHLGKGVTRFLRLDANCASLTSELGRYYNNRSDFEVPITDDIGVGFSVEPLFNSSSIASAGLSAAPAQYGALLGECSQGVRVSAGATSIEWCVQITNGSDVTYGNEVGFARVSYTFMDMKSNAPISCTDFQTTDPSQSALAGEPVPAGFAKFELNWTWSNQQKRNYNKKSGFLVTNPLGTDI